MAEDLRIAVFENGELSVPVKGGKGNEAVLALPLDRLLVKVVKVPADSDTDVSAYLTDILKSVSPFPDEELTVSYETVRESEEGSTVLAAALPEGSADDIAEALDGAGINVTRVDSLALGALRSAWPLLGFTCDTHRRLLLIPGSSCISLFVLDGDCPSVIRAVSHDADLKRETMLSLIEAESSAGSAMLKETVVLGELDCAAFEGFAPVRKLDAAGIDFLAGVADRAVDPASLNALPASWREVLEETRFKTKFKRFITAAIGIWVIMLCVVIGVPKYYSHQTSKQNEISRSHQKKYRKVQEKKDQVEAVRNVSNHDLGALETLRVVADSLPEGIVLSRWNFKRGDLLAFSGTSDGGNHQSVSAFKDSLSNVMLSSISGNAKDEDIRFFTEVELPRGIVTRNGKAVFDIECNFKDPEEEY